MSLNSVTFLFYFLPLSVIIYYLLPNKVKKLYLLIISILFYSYNNLQNTLLLIGLCCYNYFASKKLFQENYKYKKFKLIEILFINIFLLCYFKYYFLLLDIIKPASNYKHLVLALGFSFYLFTILSYVIDVYMKKITKCPNFITFCLYITFFPKLLMGPIVRYEDFSKEIDKIRTSPSLFNLGFKRLIIGLAMKLILADTFSIIITNIQVNSLVGGLILIISYSLQLYFDFAGYTNMAIGISNIFGIEIKENFNYPYISISISDFWRRWHISLGSWFRDYVYIPLGGNRCGKLKWLRNTLIVWLLTGIWHGASFNFIIWGLYFGILIIIEKLLAPYIHLPKVITIPVTFLLVSIGWIFFFNSNITDITNLLIQLVDFKHLIDPNAIFVLKTFFPYFILGIIAITPCMKIIGQFFQKKANICYNIVNVIYLSLLLILAISYLISSSYQPFLYFNF